jgi:hypothetical protein
LALLRGLVREQRHWLGFPDYFAANVRDRTALRTTVITLDLAGFGSENDAGPRTIAGFVDDLRERLRRSIDAGDRAASSACRSAAWSRSTGSSAFPTTSPPA